MIASLLGVFMLVTQQPFGVMAFSQSMFCTLGVAVSVRYIAGVCKYGAHQQGFPV